MLCVVDASLTSGACGSKGASGPITPGLTGLAGGAVMTATLDDVTRSKRPEPTAEEMAATELVRLVRTGC
jgi:hypothetical protein